MLVFLVLPELEELAQLMLNVSLNPALMELALLQLSSELVQYLLAQLAKFVP